jgi:hypothetical protein
MAAKTTNSGGWNGVTGEREREREKGRRDVYVDRRSIL